MARVLLGHPKKMHGWTQAGGSLREQSVNDIKDRRHSVYSRGFDVSKNTFGTGSGSNEFLVKKAEQMYPEFRVAYKRR